MPEMSIEDYIRSHIIEDDKDGFIMLNGSVARAIADYIEKIKQNVEVVRCKDCRKRKTPHCPLCDIIVEEDGWNETIHHRKLDYTEDDGYCDRGERR